MKPAAPVILPLPLCVPSGSCTGDQQVSTTAWGSRVCNSPIRRHCVACSSAIAENYVHAPTARQRLLGDAHHPENCGPTPTSETTRYSRHPTMCPRVQAGPVAARQRPSPQGSHGPSLPSRPAPPGRRGHFIVAACLTVRQPCSAAGSGSERRPIATTASARIGGSWATGSPDHFRSADAGRERRHRFAQAHPARRQPGRRHRCHGPKCGSTASSPTASGAPPARRPARHPHSSPAARSTSSTPTMPSSTVSDPQPLRPADQLRPDTAVRPTIIVSYDIGGSGCVRRTGTSSPASPAPFTPMAPCAWAGRPNLTSHA